MYPSGRLVFIDCSVRKRRFSDLSESPGFLGVLVVSATDLTGAPDTWQPTSGNVLSVVENPVVSNPVVAMSLSVVTISTPTLAFWPLF
jgi:hypothetical protein